MKIASDSIFQIGSQHLRNGMPCQDYAVSGVYPSSCYAIVSDGCSSGGKTDVGSRITALNTAVAVRLFKADHAMIKAERDLRDALASRALGLQRPDLLATCGYLVLPDGAAEISARLYGDGVIASVGPRGLLMSRYDWAKNMPLYPQYTADEIESFISLHGGDLDAVAAHQHIHCRPADSDPGDELRPLSIRDGIAGFSIDIEWSRSNTVAVFSDGVTQVQGMDWRDVVTELMSFKSTEGEFVKRRMNRFLKDCRKYGNGPIDDISMACIHIDYSDRQPAASGLGADAPRPSTDAENREAVAGAVVADKLTAPAPAGAGGES